MAKRIFEADIEAPAFVKKGGLASQYLKADGSVSTNNGGTLGANLFPYRIKTTILTGDPTAGHLVYSDATQINSTQINVSNLVEDNFDVKLFFKNFNVGDKLIIQDRDNSANNQIWQITLPLVFDQTTFVKIEGVTLISSEGTGTTNFANNYEVFMVRQAGAIVIPTFITVNETLDFTSISSNDFADVTVTVTGASVNDSVCLGAPDNLEAGLMFSGWVTATNVVRIRLHQTTGSTIRQRSAVWRITLIKF